MEKSGKKAVAKKKGRQQHGEPAPQPLTGPTTLIGIAKRISGGVVGTLSGSAAEPPQAGDEARPDEVHGTALEQKQHVLHSHRGDAKQYQQFGPAPQLDGISEEGGEKAAHSLNDFAPGHFAASVLNWRPRALLVALVVVLGLLALILASSLKQAASTPLQPVVSQLLELSNQVSRITEDELPALQASLSPGHIPLHQQRLDDLDLKLEGLKGTLHSLRHELHALSANATASCQTCSNPHSSSSPGTVCPVCGGHHHFHGAPCPVAAALMHVSKLDSTEAALAALSGPLVPMLLHSHSPTATVTHPGQGDTWSVRLAHHAHALLHRIFLPGQHVRHPRARLITGPPAPAPSVHPAVHGLEGSYACPLLLTGQGTAVELRFLPSRTASELVAISFVVALSNSGASVSNKYTGAGDQAHLSLEVSLGLDTASTSCGGKQTKGISWVPSGTFKVNLGSSGAGGHDDGHVATEGQVPENAAATATQKLASAWLAGRGLRASTFSLPRADSDGVHGCLASSTVTHVHVKAKAEPQQHDKPVCMPYIYVHARGSL